MDRPVTSKSRGICRYYTTHRGCFAGDACKFLHGPDEKLTPYDKAKVCKYYARGHCTRGDRCWFRHVLQKAAPDDERVQFSAETCCICLEKPTTYGLLDCSHVFCLECIRQWRVPAGKSPDVVSSGTIKCCPLCRTPSRFVTPSAHFFPNGSSRRKETVDAYKASMARVPCKYFEETSRTGKPCCPFGTDCFYQHINPDGTPHVFHHGAKHSMNVYRRHRFRGTSFHAARFDYDDPIQFLQHIFENPITNLHATLDVIRASLPALMEGLALNDEHESHDSREEEDVTDGSIDPLELLTQEDNLVMQDETVTPAAEQGGLQLPPVEDSTQNMSLPPEITPLLDTHTASQAQLLPSQFSTGTSAHTHQTFIIDISDDDEEEEEGSVHDDLDTGLTHSIESSNPSLLSSTPVAQSPPEQQPTTPQSVGTPHVDPSLRRPQLEHDADPPFVTDGRGRVVWSSTRNAPGRGTTNEGRGSRHSRAGSAPRIVCPLPNSALLTSNTRGQAWGGQDTQGVDGKVGGGEQGSDTN